MSFQIFKDSMLLYMQNQQGIKSYDAFAHKLTSEYDFTIRRGFQTINNVSVLKTNTELMHTLVNLALTSAIQKREGLHTIINDIGKGILGYWTGATLNLASVPIIPATGTVQNISTTAALVSNPGTFPDTGQQIPTSDSARFLDQLIFGMQIHLLSVEGVYNTVSLYPGFPTIPPAPGILFWKGYSVPNARPTPPQTVQRRLEIAQESLDTLSNDQVISKQEELSESNRIISDTSLPESGRGTAREYSSLLQKELSTKTINATPLEIGREEMNNINEETDDIFKCPMGQSVVDIATRDIGILEYGSPPGLNYGGFLGGARINAPGRIDEMFSNVGLDNQDKVQKTGSGYYWCAAAVATWWKEAGLPIPSGAASCDNWMNWAKSNGFFSNQPKIGAAVLYGSPADAHHIGIVSAILPTGKIITIEGNTSGGGFDRNGVGVFTKSPKSYLGFIIPPPCN